MKFKDVPQRGSRGRITVSRNRFGPYQRERISPHHPCTAAQHGIWQSMADLSWLWHHLSPEQWAAWRRFAAEVYSRPNMGDSAPLEASQVFKKLNRVLATCGRPTLFDPPPLPEFAPNPVIGFEIRNENGSPAFKVRVSSPIPWEARSPLEDLMVYSWTPCNPPVDKPRNWAFLGLLPPPIAGESDITALYLAKLRAWRKLKDRKYHIPLDGSRIFIRIWQQINGFEDELRRFIGSAVVPASTPILLA